MRKGLIVIAFLLCLPNLAFALTFSQLPTNPQSKQAFNITDAQSCTIGSAVIGGGGTTCDVFWNGTNWIAYSTIPGGAGVAVNGVNGGSQAVNFSGSQVTGADKINNTSVNGQREVLSYGTPSQCTGQGICLSTTTTAIVNAGATVLPVASTTVTGGASVLVRNWLMIPHVGPPCATNWNSTTTAPSPAYTCANTPPTPALTMYAGTGGVTNYAYEVAFSDGAGGYSAVGLSATISGPATISKANAIKLTLGAWPANSVPGVCVYRQDAGAGNFNLVGKSANQTWVDDGMEGTPPVTDFECPAVAPTVGGNENLHTAIVGINGLNLTISVTPTLQIPSGTAVYTDDYGPVQQAWFDAEADGAGIGGQNAPQVINLGKYNWRTIDAVITGPQSNGMIFNGTGGAILSEQNCGPSLWVGDSYPTHSTKKMSFNNTYWQGTGQNDATHPCQVGVWQEEGQGVYWNTLIMASYPGVPWIFDKTGDGTGAGFASNVEMSNVRIQGMGDACIWIGHYGKVDDITIHHLNCASTASRLTVVDTISANVDINAANVQVYWGEVNTEGAFTIGGNPANAGYLHNIQIKGAVSGGWWGLHTECNGAGSASRGAEFFINNTTNFILQGFQIQDSAAGCTMNEGVLMGGSAPLPTGNSIIGVNLNNDITNNRFADVVNFNGKTGNRVEGITLGAGPVPSTAFVASPTGNIQDNINGANQTPITSLFANLGTYLTSNGNFVYCSDCTIANPCAGAGTGAFAKRLNGVNVCN